MNEQIKRMAEGLKKAMQAELEGQHFYLMASQNTQDTQGKQVFQQLAEEEVEHFNFLKAHHDSLLKTGHVDTTATLGTQKMMEGPHPIFSPEIRERIGSAHYEMTALSIGIQLELSSINFYRAEAEAASDPAVKSFHEKLASWEKGHLSALQAQMDELKEGYWHEQGFAPF